jgi:ClpP class serine protease
VPTLNEILNETQSVGSGFDVVRRKYIKELSDYTGRNVIIYYSGWLQKPMLPGLAPLLQVNDNDKNGFMATIHNLVRTRGLDLLLHTPGGDIAATESLVDYLRKMFGTNIRAIVPQLAMSAGTMIALSCKEIVMGKQSNLGPIDPQISMCPARGVLEEFRKAQEEIRDAKTDQDRVARVATWQPIIAKYTPALIGECSKAVDWSAAMVIEWLKTGMFAADDKAEEKAQRIVTELNSHEETKTHARHIHADRLRELGVKITTLEEDEKLQDAVLTVHHACINTLGQTGALKIIENQESISFIVAAAVQQLSGIPIPMPQPMPGQPRSQGGPESPQPEL